MNPSEITFQPASRIASFKPYFFAALSQKINVLKAKNIDVIRIDMGSPDLPPAEFIIDALDKSARRKDTHGFISRHVTTTADHPLAL